MKPQMGKKSRFAWLIGTAAVLLYGGTAAASELSVCVDTSSPTAAVDKSIAQAIATQEGSTLVLHAFDGSGGNDDDNNGNSCKADFKMGLVPSTSGSRRRIKTGHYSRRGGRGCESEANTTSNGYSYGEI